ncbi:hypothetical protein ASE04_29710 [Rhizobium sp. Root708]|uniref:response regulator n=1 Tax=Rhizobium sp. Root708 TaxID=1736592 RepID=UPI0006FF876E|nr:response regulator [Rhizobium sp. Root708]KRB52725.1 hypothetical protein ASE04_29710 [Rhizobium sp. Root708]
MERLNDVGHVLVLEDEAFIMLDLEEMLRELGATSVTSFETRATALQCLGNNRPDISIVDRPNDGVCSDVVEFLAAVGVPFIVHSGADVDETVFRTGAILEPLDLK